MTMNIAIVVALIVGTGLGLLVGAVCNSWSNADREEELDDLREMLDDVEQQYKLATEAAVQARAELDFLKRGTS